MVEMAKNANFWSNGLIVVIFFPRYQQDLTKTLKHGWYGLVWWKWPILTILINFDNLDIFLYIFDNFNKKSDTFYLFVDNFDNSLILNIF